MRDYANDERVISAFLLNYKMSDVMRDARISKATAYKLKRDPEFQKIIQDRKTEIVTAAVNKMQAGLVRCVDELQKIIDAPDTKDQVRINACQVMMTQLREWVTTEDILRRLEALESPQKPEIETVSGVNDENIGS